MGRSTMVLQWRCEQLIRVVITQIVALGRGQAGIVLRPGEELALGIVSVIKLGEKNARACLVLDLLESFVLRVWKIGVIGRRPAWIRQRV